jgi:hypothetical protein
MKVTSASRSFTQNYGSVAATGYRQYGGCANYNTLDRATFVQATTAWGSEAVLASESVSDL